MTKYGANYDWLLLMTTQVTSGAPIDPEARHPSMRIMAVTEEIRTPFARAILWSISYLLPYDFWPVLYRTCIAWSIEWYKRVIFNLRYARPFIIFIRSKLYIHTITDNASFWILWIDVRFHGFYCNQYISHIVKTKINTNPFSLTRKYKVAR